MAEYRIYRLREARRSSFRWRPHTSGVTEVKPGDYNEDGAAAAPTPYAVWSQLREGDRPLELGDLLEGDSGELRIFKYVGFEEARWVLPEVPTGLEMSPVAAGQPSP